jgi:hypothetical protein
MTLAKEHLPYPLAAVENLPKKILSIDGDTGIPIFVLDHIVALMVAAKGSLLGLILLSADRGKMYYSALIRTQYLASLEDGPPYATQIFVGALTKEVQIIEIPVESFTF